MWSQMRPLLLPSPANSRKQNSSRVTSDVGTYNSNKNPQAKRTHFGQTTITTTTITTKARIRTHLHPRQQEVVEGDQHIARISRHVNVLAAFGHLLERFMRFEASWVCHLISAQRERK